MSYESDTALMTQIVEACVKGSMSEEHMVRSIVATLQANGFVKP